MAQDVRRSAEKTITYVTSGQRTEDLSRGTILRWIALRLKGAPTLLAANNTIAKTKNGDEWAVVKLIELIVNGNQVIRSISGEALWWLNYIMFGTPPKITPAIGDGATANPSFDSFLMLPMEMFRCVRPADTWLDTGLLSDFKIRITWGTFTDINGDASAWTTQPTLDVYTCRSSRFQIINGQQTVMGPYALQTIYQTSKTITATDPKFQVQLPLGDIYRGFLFNTTDGGVDQGDIINNIKLKSGTVVFFDQPDELLHQFDMWLKPGINNPIPGQTAAGVYDVRRRATGSSIDGWYWMDLVNDGRMTEAIASRTLSELFLEFDVTVGAGTTYLNIIPIQVRPIVQ